MKNSKITDYKFSIPYVDAKKLDDILDGIDKSMPIIICGSTDCAIKSYAYFMYKGYHVSHFVDRNVGAQKNTPFFIDVISYEELKSIYCREIIFIASYKVEICKEIKEIICSFVQENKIITIPSKIRNDYLPLPISYREKDNGIFFEKKLNKNVPITVVSIVYNTPQQYLRRSIESVLSQSFRNFKYLIVDHASNDGITSEIIREYEQLDSRIQVVRTNINYVNEMLAGRSKDMVGLYEIMESLIQTKYACMLDSDDCFETQYLERAYRALEKHSADAFFIGAISYGEYTFNKGQLWESFFLPSCDRVAETKYEKIFNYANSYSSIGGWGAMCRTELFKQAYRTTWVNTNLTSDLKAGYYMAMNSQKSVYSGHVCLYYVNRNGAVTQILKSKVLQRLDNIIDLCLTKRLDEMKTELQMMGVDYEKILYRYTEYHLMVLVQYLNEITVQQLTDDCKKEVLDRICRLMKDEYIDKVINTRQKQCYEINRLIHNLGEGIDGGI